MAVSVCPAGQLPETIEEVELAAGLPSPHFSGKWSKTSPDIKRSYLFINGMSVDDTDLVIDFATKCGFSTIMIGSGTWTDSEGHFPINTRFFPRGIEDLKVTADRFKQAGFRVGLHFLAAAVHPNDAYISPVPDRRLVQDGEVTLAADVDEAATTILSTTAPETFPATEGGYEGNSAVIRIGDDGAGLPEKLRPGVGLRSMRERAARVNGSFALSSSPGQGAHLTVSVPLGG